MSLSYNSKRILCAVWLIAGLLLGVTTTFAEDPKGPRIISLAPNLTETIFALGAGDELVGVTDYCVYPPEARELPRVGGLYDLSVEHIIKLDPDIVFHLPSHTEDLRPLKGFGIDTVLVSSETVADIYAGIELVGEKLGRSEEASELVDQIKQRMETVEQKVSGKKKVVLYVVAYSPVELREIYAAGPGTFLDELVTIAGGENMMMGSSARYPTVSREYLIAHPPDVLIDNNSGRQEEGEEEQDALRDRWMTFLGEGAIDKTRVVIINDSHLTVPGPSVADSVEKIAEMIHGKPPETATPTPQNE